MNKGTWQINVKTNSTPILVLAKAIIWNRRNLRRHSIHTKIDIYNQNQIKKVIEKQRNYHRFLTMAMLLIWSWEVDIFSLA